MDKELITINEMAEFLRVPKSWIYARTRETVPDSIPRVKVGKYVRFVKNEVMAWLKRQNEAD